MIETPKEAAKRLAGPMLIKGYVPAALHAYTDEQGEALYWRIRAKHPSTGEKWIRPMHLNGRGFEFGEPKYPEGKPLYGLHRIASNPEAVIWITEGEQKADALNRLGLVATTTGGATSAGTADWRPLRGRACIIWPDNDEPGKAYAGEVASILLGLGCSVQCVAVDKLGLAEGEDAIEWLEASPTASRSDLEGLPMLAPTPSPKNAPNREIGTEVELVRGCDVPPEAVRWLWKGWLAAGKFQILGGAPGTGKTTISMALAATVTTGGRWPDGSRAEQGNVVVWSGEDDPADTLIPRLALSRADLARVYFVSDVREDGGRRAFDPARDTEVLGRKLAEIGGVRLLIVDPIVSAISGDSHKNAEVRRGLQPLANLAAEMGCALLGITHFSKGTGGRDPVERLTGSLAFGALARVVLVAAKHQTEGNDGRTVRIFLRAKSNIGPDDGGFEYDLHQSELQTHPGLFASSVLWGNPVEGAARELLAGADAADDDGEGGTLADAKRFLADLLADGPMPVNAIRRDANGAGYSWATIRRAQKALGVEAIKGGMASGWKWSYSRRCSTNPEDAQQKEVSTFAKSGHLRTDPDTVEVEI